MTPEEFKERQDRFVNHVRLMRGYQRSWFKYKLGRDLKSAKRYEAIVDRELAEMEVLQKESKQPEIFSQELGR
jgi:hypothetical protein